MDRNLELEVELPAESTDVRRGGSAWALYAIGIAFSVFQIWTAAYSPISSLVVRSVHVGFLVLMIFGISAELTKNKAHATLLWSLGILGFVLGLYHWVYETEIMLRSGIPSMTDLVIGVIVIILVFDATRRLMGWALPILCGLALLYGLFGEYLPGALATRGYGLDQIIEQMFMGTEGIYGTPIYVSSTYIFLFILFGTFLERAGMIKLFTDVSMGLVGHLKGGPAKVSVFSSGLMGTINGSGVANVVTTGQFTIPLMKRFGYSSVFSGAVEATSSMGGQIMPPVMGAVAFIMAETLGVPYVEIVKAAIIPALLYFAAAFWAVHLEAGHKNLRGLPKEMCPSAWGALKAGWYLILPLAILVYLLFSGYTPLFSGTVGLALTIVLILGAAIALNLSGTALRVIFWVVLGLLCGSFFEFGITAIGLIIIALIAGNLFVKGGRETVRLSVDSLAEGARHAVSVGIACAIVGVLIGIFTLTGVAVQFAEMILAFGRSSLFLSLVLTMIACLLLGTGLPTIPNYIITSAIAAPALLELGVPLLVSHMFVFYFGIMADLTPPVALAAFAAAPIARASGMAIGWQASKIAIPGYVVPFMAVYDPALMAQTGDWLATAYMAFKAIVSIGLWGAAMVGFLHTKLNWPERIWATAAAFLLVLALPITDELGFGLGFLFIVWHWWRSRGATQSEPA
ncbi:TRAP transporter 4TM/12TM fusion protein [Rhodoligotrophos appendicifer]|uniref:TRAP transporter permease n=1 Tax=Rhodoligotrophos appendicifer TaxID=987056 RepID=UPI00117F8B37|nr:TRAP transporter permease [Rhodoligotrophos appendicifer]